jgi:hypothetical protein
VEVASAEVAEAAPETTTGMAITASFAAPSVTASGGRERPSPFGANAREGWSSGEFAVARSWSRGPFVGARFWWSARLVARSW